MPENDTEKLDCETVPSDDLRELVERWKDIAVDSETDSDELRYGDGMAEGAESAARELKRVIDRHTGRDPAEDPRACSVCGVYIGFGDDEYCDGCAREIGAKPPLRRCMGCGQRAPEEEMEPVDISPEDEYYPTIRYLCRGCSGGESE